MCSDNLKKSSLLAPFKYTRWYVRCGPCSGPQAQDTASYTRLCALAASPLTSPTWFVHLQSPQGSSLPVFVFLSPPYFSPFLFPLYYFITHTFPPFNCELSSHY